tara:strand:- start:102 stop:773 length:672 start_codon:yes stop_codon:yes gene_type:complete
MGYSKIVNEKGLVIKNGLAYEEGSTSPFHGEHTVLVTENNLQETSTYNQGRLIKVRLFDIHGVQIENIVIEVLDQEGNIQTNEYKDGLLVPSLSEKYNFKSLTIKFLLLKHKATCEIYSAHTLLKEFQTISLESVKQVAREFLNNPENIKEIIEGNHKLFLKEKGISGFERAGTFYPSKKTKKRTTHCYNCRDPLNSFDDLSCKACKWILCSCGACGCGFQRY